ncbi:MAG TPA: HNH endonuclease [Mycobacteriales bacterium]|nr:HNH endonuclease [Mycobacteriales bacterium]
MAEPLAHALVLNASYEPLCVVPGRRAVVLLLTDKAVAVEEADQQLHSERRTVPVPVVVKLTRYVKVPYAGTVPLTRRAVFARDGGRCQYCSAPATSLDHVVPRSRGGPHTWENVVSACGRCNHTKADRGVAELGWRLRRTPAAPSGAAWRVVGARRLDPRWRPFLGVDEDAWGDAVWETPA